MTRSIAKSLFICLALMWWPVAQKARARLVEFRRQYPHWIIPTDLAPLLRE